MAPDSRTLARGSEIEMEIEQRLTSEERDLGGVMESLATMLEEVNEFSAAVSQKHDMFIQITDAINQDP